MGLIKGQINSQNIIGFQLSRAKMKNMHANSQKGNIIFEKELNTFSLSTPTHTFNSKLFKILIQTEELNRFEMCHKQSMNTRQK